MRVPTSVINHGWARVTTWNPGAPSYGTAHNASFNIYESSWSYMTDGRATACTGIEIVYYIQSQPDSGAFETDSMGWPERIIRPAWNINVIIIKGKNVKPTP